MKIICIGRNYAEHVKELNNNRPDSPVIFLKPDTSIILKNQPFFIPEFSSEINYEVEIILKICKLGKHIENKYAHKYFNQIGLGIDFTARDTQNELKSNGLPWEKAKAFDGSALVGSWVNKTKFNDLRNLNFSLNKNG
jgi:2-keto-4-pentenoate hydratase/2-oxohepta-3-ene-1,7-dioic acid hydratase in catechol pathway